MAARDSVQARDAFRARPAGWTLRPPSAASASWAAMPEPPPHLHPAPRRLPDAQGGGSERDGALMSAVAGERAAGQRGAWGPHLRCTITPKHRMPGRQSGVSGLRFLPGSAERGAIVLDLDDAFPGESVAFGVIRPLRVCDSSANSASYSGLQARDTWSPPSDCPWPESGCRAGQTGIPGGRCR